MKTFTLTENHIKLLRAAYVYFDDSCESGGPSVDPKRPYGNSDVENDIHEILTGEKVGYDQLSRAKVQEYTQLHRETGTALQIILDTGKFEPGEYETKGYEKGWVKKV
jgi:hypothetical protein